MNVRRHRKDGQQAQWQKETPAYIAAQGQDKRNTVLYSIQVQSYKWVRERGGHKGQMQQKGRTTRTKAAQREKRVN